MKLHAPRIFVDNNFGGPQSFQLATQRIAIFQFRQTKSTAGKIEPGEEPANALCRELAEELGLAVTPAELTFVARFTAPAANEPGLFIFAEVFRLRTDAVIEPGAEIEEAVWIDPVRPARLDYAPLTRDFLIKLLAMAA